MATSSPEQGGSAAAAGAAALAGDPAPLVGVIMGSRSDWATLEHASLTLAGLGVPHEVRVVSAHRTPDQLFSYAEAASGPGLLVIIAGAGGAAHLPGMTAAKTAVPVLGVPIESKALLGLDSFLSIAQLPAGIPVGTLAIGRAGAVRVGVIGGGQLGQLLALAGLPLGITTVHLDPSAETCAGRVAPLLVGPYGDPRLIGELSRGADVVTVDLEQVPPAAFAQVAPGVPVWPPPGAVAVAQDRLLEKRLFRELGIDIPAFAPVDGPADLAPAAREVGLPLILKTRSGGYDGRGQVRVSDAAALEHAWRRLGGRPLVAEAVVDFEREVSVVAVRGRDGETRAYPLIENEHAGGILRVSRVPAATGAALAAEGLRSAQLLLDRLGHVGVLTLELFEAGGRLLANEFAPRVHNSGHWTIEGAETCQFENHLRAICGLPLGATAARVRCALVNLIGALPPTERVLVIPGARLHVYGKEPAPGRKLGHVTVTSPDREELERRLAGLLEVVGALGAIE